MKYINLFLWCFLSVQIVLLDSISAQRVDDALFDFDHKEGRSIDSFLIAIQQFPREECKPALSEITKSIFNENPNDTLQKMCVKALMSYNDVWSYGCISYEIDRAKCYSSVVKSFFDVYEENENPMYKPLKQKFEVPVFINDSFVLNDTNFSAFVENWSNYSSLLMIRDKVHPINEKVHDFYRWIEHRGYETYVTNCSERDSLCNLSKRKYRDRIAILEDQIKEYIDGMKNDVYLFPRTIDVCYTTDSFSKLKEIYELESIIPGICYQSRVDSQTVIVPYLVEFNSKRVSKGNGDTRFFLMDTYIKNLLGTYAKESERNYKKISRLFNVSISVYENHIHIDPNSYPIITNICSYSDGVLFYVEQKSSGYCVFFPNDEGAKIESFGEWIE